MAKSYGLKNILGFHIYENPFIKIELGTQPSKGGK